VRVEDGGLGLTHLANREGAQVLDVAAYLGDGLDQAPPLASGVADLTVVDLDRGDVEPAYRADRDAGRGGDRTRGRRELRQDRRLGRLVEGPRGEREHVLDGLLCLRSGGSDLDPVALLGAQRRDPAEARGGHRAGPGREVGEGHRSVEPADLADQSGRRSRVQTVPVGDREHADDLVADRRRRDLGRVLVGNGQVRRLAEQGVARLGGDLGPARSTGRRHRGDHQALHDRGGREDHPLADRRILQQVQRQLGTEHGAAEIHQDDDAVGPVDLLDRVLDLYGVGAERRLVEAGRDLDPYPAAVEHLTRECQRSPGQCPAVGDDDDADAWPGSHGHSPFRQLSPERRRRPRSAG
jgi:hypothetical protein